MDKQTKTSRAMDKLNAEAMLASMSIAIENVRVAMASGNDRLRFFAAQDMVDCQLWAKECSDMLTKGYKHESKICLVKPNVDKEGE